MKRFISLAFIWSGVILTLSCSQSSNEMERATSVIVVESSVSWDGSNLPDYPEGIPKVSLLRITIPPKSKLDIHKHPIINVGYMTRGELIVVSEDGEKKHLKTGEGIVELVDKYHYGENPNNEPAEIIVFYAGNTESAFTEYKY